MSAHTRHARLLLVSLLGCGACSDVPSIPLQPTWSDVEPILRGQCVSCHGPTAKDTGSSYRLDFYEMTPAICGDAALALDAAVILAGGAGTPALIRIDVEPMAGVAWPRMPPQPSPALPDWQRETLARWATSPVKGPPPHGNRAPTITTSKLPALSDRTFTFTAILDDPDGDPVIGVIKAGGFAFLMNRPGSFAVAFDTAAWPAGSLRPTAVLCDGWMSASYDLGPVEIKH